MCLIKIEYLSPNPKRRNRYININLIVYGGVVEHGVGVGVMVESRLLGVE